MLADFGGFGAATEERGGRRGRGGGGVYIGYHDHHFPQAPADKHRQHVV